MRFVQQGIVWLAVVLLLGHNTVPHQHDATVADVCGEQAAGWLEALQHIFHPDLGAHHLEDLADAGRVILGAFVAPHSTAAPVLWPAQTTLGPSQTTCLPLERGQPSGHRLRGPPVKI